MCQFFTDRSIKNLLCAVVIDWPDQQSNVGREHRIVGSWACDWPTMGIVFVSMMSDLNFTGVGNKCFRIYPVLDKCLFPDPTKYIFVRI